MTRLEETELSVQSSACLLTKTTDFCATKMIRSNWNLKWRILPVIKCIVLHAIENVSNVMILTSQELDNMHLQDLQSV